MVVAILDCWVACCWTYYVTIYTSFCLNATLDGSVVLDLFNRFVVELLLVGRLFCLLINSFLFSLSSVTTELFSPYTLFNLAIAYWVAVVFV
jgi:hypothetical protein